MPAAAAGRVFALRTGFAFIDFLYSLDGMIAPYLLVHFTRFDQYAPDILPFAMFSACLAWKLARLAVSAFDSFSRLGDPATPCWPNRIVFT